MATPRKASMRQFLVEQPKENLADWILSVARDMPDFRQRLEFYAATVRNPEESVEVLETVCRELSALAMRQSQNVRVNELAPRATFLLEALENLLKRGQLIDSFHLCGKCAWLIDMAMTRLAASSTRMSRLLQSFENLHFRIAMQKPVDPATLAERIFTQQVNSAHDFMLHSLPEYAELLGETGIAAYRRKLDRVYRIMVDGETLEDRSQHSLRTHVQEAKLLQRWGEFTRNRTEKIAICIAFAPHPDEVLRIADAIEKSGTKGEAVDAVLRACDRFQNPAPTALFEYLAVYFEGEGRFDKALEYRWELYRTQPGEGTYRKLIAAAAPIRQAEDTREDALDFAAEKNNSLYTRLLVLEGKLEDALDQARAHGATTEVWALLARAHAPKDPHTAIQLFFDCAKYSIRAYRADYYATISAYLAEAWALATDVQTCQTYSQRLKSFFVQNYCPPRMHEAVQNAGVPLEQLLKS
jgi:hypothetical protein